MSNNTNKVQFKENAATKDEQTPHSDDENMNDSDIEDKRNQCREPSKEQWTERNESRRKIKIYVYLNGMNDPIVLEPELKSSKKYLNQAKYSKILKKYWKDEIKSSKSYNDVEKTASRKAKNIFSMKKLLTVHTKKMIPQMVLTYVKNVNHLRKDNEWFIAQTVSFGTMTAAFQHLLIYL